MSDEPAVISSTPSTSNDKTAADRQRNGFDVFSEVMILNFGFYEVMQLLRCDSILPDSPGCVS